MTPPLEVTPRPTHRTTAALWGTAHLAWGIVIFLALVYAMQQWPVEATPRRQRQAWTFVVVALAWMAVSGWQSVERGWRLRWPRPVAGGRSLFEVVVDGIIGAIMIVAILRAGDSQLLAAGLDRLVSSLATIGVLSAVLRVAASVALGRSAAVDGGDRLTHRLCLTRLVLGGLVLAGALIIEFRR
jgi:hypothetical protein